MLGARLGQAVFFLLKGDGISASWPPWLTRACASTKPGSFRSATATKTSGPLGDFSSAHTVQHRPVEAEHGRTGRCFSKKCEGDFQPMA